MGAQVPMKLRAMQSLDDKDMLQRERSCESLGLDWQQQTRSDKANANPVAHARTASRAAPVSEPHAMTANLPLPSTVAQWSP